MVGNDSPRSQVALGNENDLPSLAWRIKRFQAQLAKKNNQ
jgi:hypothetical protein